MKAERLVSSAAGTKVWFEHGAVGAQEAAGEQLLCLCLQSNSQLYRQKGRLWQNTKNLGRDGTENKGLAA